MAWGLVHHDLTIGLLWLVSRTLVVQIHKSTGKTCERNKQELPFPSTKQLPDRPLSKARLRYILAEGTRGISQKGNKSLYECEAKSVIILTRGSAPVACRSPDASTVAPYLKLSSHWSRITLGPHYNLWHTVGHDEPPEFGPQILSKHSLMISAAASTLKKTEITPTPNHWDAGINLLELTFSLIPTLAPYSTSPGYIKLPDNYSQYESSYLCLKVEPYC